MLISNSLFPSSISVSSNILSASSSVSARYERTSLNPRQRLIDVCRLVLEYYWRNPNVAHISNVFVAPASKISNASLW